MLVTGTVNRLQATVRRINTPNGRNPSHPQNGNLPTSKNPYARMTPPSTPTTVKRISPFQSAVRARAETLALGRLIMSGVTEASREMCEGNQALYVKRLSVSANIV